MSNNKNMIKSSKGDFKNMSTKEKKTGFNKAEYDKAFHKKNYTCIAFNLRNVEDSDVLEKIKSVSNKAEYIRTLVRNDISKTK